MGRYSYLFSYSLKGHKYIQLRIETVIPMPQKSIRRSILNRHICVPVI